MPVPKSVIKIKKGGVEYTSSVDRAIYTMEELERGALKDIAKFIRSEMRKRLKANDSVDTRNLYRAVTSWVRKSTPRFAAKLQIGWYSKSKAESRGLKDAFYGSFLEFGTKNARAKPFLKPAVFENIEKIREIEAKYLSYIEDEKKALRIIDEKEELTDAE